MTTFSTAVGEKRRIEEIQQRQLRIQKISFDNFRRLLFVAFAKELRSSEVSRFSLTLHCILSKGAQFSFSLF